eukprot:CAMPEP_0198282502 /NCGR_PEP_ID=MMETSP1449-20131203/2292_1 /TAXON_ID=420275 /ORGANISM="Attheya septentrionalis, Strain CCMP2084" /LENGTH=568 /DNA_ID=CAMNT_0043978767 /DNA_START=177 /DNA_END=1883 /DNA_ORIENTATION=-
MMEDLLNLVAARNATETLPFLSVHAANAALQNLVDSLQSRCDELEGDCMNLQLQLEELSEGKNGGGQRLRASLKNETRLRDKIEKLQEDLNEKLRIDMDASAAALKTANDLAGMKDMNSTLEGTIIDLRKANEKLDETVNRLKEGIKDAKSHTRLAEKQYAGLKDTIRGLQEENDVIKSENTKLVDRLVSEKEKSMDQIREMSETVEKLVKEIEMLKSLKKLEETQKKGLWFMKAGSLEDGNGTDDKQENKQDNARQWGTLGVIIPTEAKHVIQAHSSEVTSVRYDGVGSDLVATSSNDSTVRVWDTSSGAMRATLRGGSGHAMMGCDIVGGLVVGCASDKSCRVWKLSTQRMIHQLVGHGNKVTCARLISGGKEVLTASADRSIKLWDISRNTYRQTTTLRHSSTANCLDVSYDTKTAVSGHMDGGVRFWDIRSGEKTAEIETLHTGGVTCAHLHPTNGTQILTNGRDSVLKLVDIRMGSVISTMTHKDFRTPFNWSACSYSPDGVYAAAGSGTTGDIMIWRVDSGEFIKKLSTHRAGVGGFAWGKGGSCGQQVASVDTSGKLVLWA